MALHVVMDHPRRHVSVRLRRALTALVGFLLILVGLSAVPATVVVAVLSRGDHGRTSSTIGTGTVVGFLAALAAVTLICPLLGVRLVRGSRRLVVFLRRFGYSEATRALSFAAVRTIGRSWRLVTLDDAAIAPLGVPASTVHLFDAGRSGSRWIGRAWKRIVGASFTVMTVSIAGMAGVAVYLLLHHHLSGGLSDALDHRKPTRADAAGVFRVFFVATVGAAFVGLGVALAVLPLLALLGSYLFLSFSGRALRDAEQSKVTRVTTVGAARAVAGSLRRQARRIFSPRLFVLNVDSDVWRPTVTILVAQASVVLIDVSEPTENLLWEIAEVTRTASIPCVLVANRERLDASDNPLAEQLVEMLGGRTVLAYEPDRKGMRRFARALRATLEGAMP